MAAGATDRLWEIADIVTLVEAADVKPENRGPDGPRAKSGSYYQCQSSCRDEQK